jgi:retron-type reverse transcriptase
VIGPDLFSFSDLWRHYRVCRRNKRTTHSALAFEIDLEANLLTLQAELRERRYRPGRSICFVTDGPKPREVFAADFRDRIVHHLLVAHQERVFEPRFIHDSYACRRGKGTLAASDRAMGFMREASANGRRPAWALKLDVASFFASLHKETLFALLQRRIRHPDLLWLTEVVLFHDPTRDYHFKTRGRAIPPPGAPGHPIRPEKSLFGTSNQRGLPIGNLTSQFWANVYLNEIDQFVKRELRVRHYVRYVDDMLLLAASPDELLAWRDRIARALDQRLHLRLRPEPAIPQRVARGIDFVGWRTWPTRRAVRRSTRVRLDTRLRHFARAHVRPALDGLAQRIDLDRPATRAALAPLQSTVASYAGHFSRGAAGDWVDIWRAHAWLAALFDRTRGRLALRWKTSRASSVSALRTPRSRDVPEIAASSSPARAPSSSSTARSV